MPTVPDAFTYDHRGTELIYGRGRVADLDAVLVDRGLDRALVVCGSHVGANRDLMDPLEAGLGDRLTGVFDGTTPAKRVETVFDGLGAIEETGADAIVAVGGGSSLDVARQMSVFADDDRTLADLESAAEANGTVEPPHADDPIPVIVVPTTFAGADVSSGGSVEVRSAEDSPTGQPIRTSGRVTPTAGIYDPDLFETTPRGALTGSAMNGFDKGIETLYASDATPISDSMAVHGLSLLVDGLPRLDDPDGMERSIAGLLLVQIERRISIVHAFGHGFARRYDVQQGHVHAVVVPHVLRYLFGEIEGRRRLIARGLGLEVDGLDDEAVAEVVVEAVADLRDAMALPTRLQDLDGTVRDDLPAIAEFVVGDVGDSGPDALDPTAGDIEAVLREAW